MFLNNRHHPYCGGGFPRVCGDVPQSVGGGVFAQVFSPRMRGCSAVNVLFHVVMHVFPAYAGMFLVADQL